MKGSRNRLGLIGAAAAFASATAFASAFLTGAVVTFGVASLVGAAALTSLPLVLREHIAAGVLFALAVVDVLAIRRRSYCALGISRQTPKNHMYRFNPILAAATWGFDAGLVLTTFRVAAITWGALVLALLGLATWSTGVAYGIAFAAPLIVLLLCEMTNARLSALIAWRPLVQAGSALTLCTAALLLL